MRICAVITVVLGLLIAATGASASERFHGRAAWGGPAWGAPIAWNRAAPRREPVRIAWPLRRRAAPGPNVRRFAQYNHYDARRALRSGRVLPLGRILGAVRQRFRGRQLGVRLQRRGARYIYFVRWLTPQNRVYSIAVDASTARILSVR